MIIYLIYVCTIIINTITFLNNMDTLSLFTNTIMTEYNISTQIHNDIVDFSYECLGKIIVCGWLTDICNEYDMFDSDDNDECNNDEYSGSVVMT